MTLGPVPRAMARLFGTNGVRGVVGTQLTPELAMDLARALGTTLVRGGAAADAERPTVILGRDHRTSGPWLSAATTAGLLATGCDVWDAGPVPTPALQYAVRQRHEAVAGVVLTASHNPPEFNGIKVVRGDGREMTPEEEDEIEAVYRSRAFAAASWEDHGEARPLPGVVDAYHEAIRRQVDWRAISAQAPSVVVDAANGAACGSLPQLLRSIGCRVVTLNGNPDGTFPGHPSEPVAENAGALQALVREVGADLGVLVDGDADRAVFIDEQGAYHAGDRSLALLAADAVARAGGGVVCTPLSSSGCVEEAVVRAGGRVVYTMVGSPRVAAAMVDEEAVFGGEENGGLIFPAHQWTRDGAMAAAAMVDLLVRTGSPLSALMAQVPVKHTVKRKLHVPDAHKGPLVAAIRKEASGRSPPAGARVERVDDRDGVKLYLEGAWVLVRASGTEPLVRVYAEADAPARAQALADAYVATLERLVKTVGAPA